jgi:hypothetical protein
MIFSENRYPLSRIMLELAGALLLRSGAASGRRAARVVLIRHAFLNESSARRALQLLVVGAELAGRHFLLGIDRKTRPPWHKDDQGGR